VALATLLFPAAPLVHADGTWTNQTLAPPSAREWHAMASLGWDWVLLFGGEDAGGLDGETWLAAGFSDPARVYLPVVMRKQ
jgi:hypothetical protein